MSRESDLAGKWPEDLMWEATRGAALARNLCTCDGYFHELWGALRASGFVGGHESEVTQLGQVLSGLIHDETKILICGAADLGTVSTIEGLAGLKKPAITIVDNCKAPLALIDEELHRISANHHTLYEDICDLDGSMSWDLIFMHYLIPFIVPNSYAQFFKGLRSSLARGGNLICVAQISDKKIGYDEAEEMKCNWISKARAALLDAPELLEHWDSSELDVMLRRFAEARTTRRTRVFSRTETIDLLVRNGFRVLREFTVTKDVYSPSDEVTTIGASTIIHAVGAT